MTSEEYKVVEGDTDQVHHHDSHEEASSACVPFAGAQPEIFDQAEDPPVYEEAMPVTVNHGGNHTSSDCVEIDYADPDIIQEDEETIAE